MKKANLLKIGVPALLCLQLASCGYQIVFKPSPFLDPMPETKPAANSSAAADPEISKQWNLAKIGVTAEMLNSPMLAGNANIKVAILSTGIDYNHEDLRGQVLINQAEITQKALGDRPGGDDKDDDQNWLVDDIAGYDVVDGDGLAFDRHGAGTAVAGIIAAKTGNGLGIAGLMKDVSLIPVRYINDNGQASLANLIAALDVANTYKPDVVFIQNTQVPYGDREDPEVAEIEMYMLKYWLRRLATQKIPVVIGAGDDMGSFAEADKEIEKVFRGFPNVVVVTSTDQDDQLGFLANVSFSDVHLAAPGESILTTAIGNKYATVNGTAYAAAEVVAAIALAKSKLGPRFDLNAMAKLLSSGEAGDQLPGLQRHVRGGNRLNLAKLLTAVYSLN